MNKRIDKRVIGLIIGILVVIVLAVLGKNRLSNQATGESYVPGNIEGNHYENEWIGIKLDAPEQFHMLTKKELEQRMQEASEEEKDLLMDMCVSSDEMGSMTIYVEDLKNDSLTCREYLEKKQKEMLAKSGEVLKLTDEGTFSSEIIAGETYECYKIEYSLEELRLVSEYYVRIVDDCAVMIQIDYDPSTKAQRDELLQAIQEL